MTQRTALVATMILSLLCLVHCGTDVTVAEFPSTDIAQKKSALGGSGTWVAMSPGARVPSNVFQAAVDWGYPAFIYVCRGPYKGGMHIGRSDGKFCVFGYGGGAIVPGTWEILTDVGTNRWVYSHGVPTGAFVGGWEPDHSLVVCRGIVGYFPNQIGKLFGDVGGICFVGDSGREKQYREYEVLVLGTSSGGGSGGGTGYSALNITNDTGSDRLAVWLVNVTTGAVSFVADLDPGYNVSTSLTVGNMYEVRAISQAYLNDYNRLHGSWYGLNDPALVGIFNVWRSYGGYWLGGTRTSFGYIPVY